MHKTLEDYKNEGWTFGGTLAWKGASNRGRFFDADNYDELVEKMNEANA